MSGGNDGETLFQKTFPATTGGLVSTNAVDWHFKFKHIEYDAGLNNSQHAQNQICS